MSKADDDNRSNQLNPNNAAYWSSRSVSSRGSSYDDEAWDMSPAQHLQFSPRPDVRLEQAFEIGFAGAHGQVRFVRVNFEVTLCAIAQAGGFDFLGYVEFFADQLWTLFAQRWGGVTLQMVFDQKGQEIRWLTQPCTGENVEVRFTVSDPVWPRVTLIGHGEIVVARDLLLRARQIPSADWGDFVASHDVRLTKHFPHLMRCKTLVWGGVYRQPEPRPDFPRPWFG